MSMKNNQKISLISLLNEINMPTEVTDAVISSLETGEESFPGIKSLTDHLVQSLESRQDGAWKDLPHDIFVATMGCFSRFIKEYHVSYGSYGYDRAFWTTRQVAARLFRIGELEYEFTQDPHSVQLHIPSDARLTASLLNASVDGARDFLRTYFPGRENDAILLESWLLSPVLEELLPENSRILRFQAAFDLTDQDPEPMDCLEWVFHIAGGQMDNIELTNLPEGTTLQRNMKKLLLSGGKVGNASGILARKWKD